MNRRALSILLFASTASFLLGAAVESGITRDVIANAEKLIGFTFTNAKRDSMIEGLTDQLKNYENIRKVHLENNVPPALLFNPIPVGMKFEKQRKPFRMSLPKNVIVHPHFDDLAFYSIGQLSELIKTKKSLRNN